MLQPSNKVISADPTAQSLPFKAYEPTIEIRDRKSRSVFIEAPYSVETGEAERIAVDWTAKGGASGTSREYLCLIVQPPPDNATVQSRPTYILNVLQSRCFTTGS